MNRRQFLRNAAIAAAVAPHVPAAVARATTPFWKPKLSATQMTFFVDPCGIVLRYRPVDFMGSRAQCAAFIKMWNDGLEQYYDTDK